MASSSSSVISCQLIISHQLPTSSSSSSSSSPSSSSQLLRRSWLAGSSGRHHLGLSPLGRRLPTTVSHINADLHHHLHRQCYEHHHHHHWAKDGLRPARPSGPLTSHLRRSARKWEVMIFRDTQTHKRCIIIYILSPYLIEHHTAYLLVLTFLQTHLALFHLSLIL